jgi:DNA-binding response OmpR family regulator
MLRKLLWADDDVEFTTLCQRYFQSHGFEVRVVASGLDCQRELWCWSPEMLIVDDGLPWGDGEGILASLEALPLLLADDDVRVIVTGADPQGLAAHAGGKNPVQCLPKPFYLQRILEIAKAAVGPVCRPSDVYADPFRRERETPTGCPSYSL